MKSIVLLSGGLDSILAMKALTFLGEVTAIHFYIPFEHKPKEAFYSSAAAKYCKEWGVDLRVVDISEGYLEMLKNPQYGYGSNFNPCVDCKIFMLKVASQLRSELEADIVATGEVLGQRPMSQQANSLRCIEKNCGLEGYLLRPLSAKFFEPTFAEQKGLIDRESLFKIRGRQRTDQFALAKKWGITDFPPPGGGCLLTDPGYCNRMNILNKRKLINLDDIHFIRHGRFFDLDGTLMMVGRDSEDNDKLLALKKGADVAIECADIPGPYVLLRHNITSDKIDFAASVAVRYAKQKTAKVTVTQDQVVNEAEYLAADEEKIKEKLIT